MWGLSGARGWSDNVLSVHPVSPLGWVGQGSADALHGSVWVSALSLRFSVQKLLQREELCDLSGTQCLGSP